MRKSILRALTGLSVIASLSPAQALDQPGQVIWNEARVGMSWKEFRALYPKERIQLTEDCNAVIGTSFDKKGLAEVKLEWALKDRGNQCGEVVTASLREKYGEPLRREEALSANSCLNPYSGGVAGLLGQLCSATGGDEPDHYVFLQWERDGILITLKRDTGNGAFWWAVYKPIVKASADAAGKL